jgi:hypothetical protein
MSIATIMPKGKYSRNGAKPTKYIPHPALRGLSSPEEKAKEGFDYEKLATAIADR